ncbi:MAG: dolichyl-diphosphooligosaccharide--protein glycosyltransferase subunit STT3, partial [Nanoarchaeota archaeon]|nr:dolichyl-diphosphooligosaccharide--protein glycosyltransferase subunit STT3 [Nanoarchaeota archaeon]
SMRGAVRLFFIIAPLIIIVSSYLLVRFSEYAMNAKSSTSKLFLGISFIIALLLIMGTFASQATMTVQEAKATVPSIYTQQWQRAMGWVRDNTPVESIFVHWWDYGYWVQTLGERPTLTDGGHPSFAFTYESARYILTTSQPETALSMMKSLNISYLLIDSTDAGKYPAYSKIGSDENWDRFSSIPMMTLDGSQTFETEGKKTIIYRGASGVDDDLIYNSKDGEIFLPGASYNDAGNPNYNALLIGIVLESSRTEKDLSFAQPDAVFYYNGIQSKIPVRYIYYNGEILDFKSGIDSIVYVFPSVALSPTGGLQVENTGAAIYLSSRTKDTLFAQLYLMNDPFERYPTINLVHQEDDILVQSLSAQGVNSGEFIYYQGFRGPIKIWDTREIPKEILLRPEFLERDKYNAIGQGDIPFAPFDDLDFKV